MKFAVSEMVFSPPLRTPMTFDYWMEATASMDGCLQARHIQWLCSLVSVQSDRSICLYQVPYTDALREAYREARLPAQRVWQAQVAPSIPNSGTDLIVVVEAQDSVKSPSPLGSPLQNGLAPAIVLTDGSRSITLFTAIEVEAVRTHHTTTKTPFDRIWSAHVFSA